MSNLSKIKTGKVSAIRFSTLNSICKALDCQPGDILEYQKDMKNKFFVFYDYFLSCPVCMKLTELEKKEKLI